MLQRALLVCAAAALPRAAAFSAGGRRVAGGARALGAAAEPVVDLADEPLMRIGHGFDIHRMSSLEQAGQPVVIGGVTIPCDLGVEAHSDGDVIYHSVVDAILGALTLPDIGQLFPDNDPQWCARARPPRPEPKPKTKPAAAGSHPYPGPRARAHGRRLLRSRSLTRSRGRKP
mmetsp:Transcript_38329/g.120191  ORF Transcript_38329/g.120191 Transcript_38329/m.120191 type:complete len:173 (-) Transcript_38329:625-1143(-)